MEKSEKMPAEKRIKREVNRLNRIYKNLPEQRKNLLKGLIIEAARLRISLDDLWEDIEKNGDMELFSQSKDAKPYERERPAARLYNTRNKQYQQIIKQLDESIIEEKQKSKLDALRGG